MNLALLVYISVWPMLGLTGVTNFTIQGFAPVGSAVLDAMPVAVSFEFPSFPSYMNLTNTWNCLGQLQTVAGTWPHIRIGGTSEDEATYIPDLPVAIEYQEEDFSHIPSNYSRKYIEIAAKYPGQVILGLNRGANNLSNTVAAATDAVCMMDNLFALELGNEPDIYPNFNFPVAPPNFSDWTTTAEAASESLWQIEIGTAIGRQNIIQAGSFYLPPPSWGAAMLLTNENASALPYIRSFSHHNYPQTVTNATISSPPDLEALMSHSNIVKNLGIYANDVRASNEAGKPYFLGETNSISGGGSPTISPTFGAALWLLDYSLQAASLNISRMYFHQGTIGSSHYVWWTPDGIRSPYYGAYVATMAMAGGKYIAKLDSGADNYAGYVIYSEDRSLRRVVLVNSNYFDGASSRPAQNFVLTGLGGLRTSLKARRLTAASSTDRQEAGQMPSFAGQAFLDDGCALNGTETVEMVEVVDGVAAVALLASEAVILEF